MFHQCLSTNHKDFLQNEVCHCLLASSAVMNCRRITACKQGTDRRLVVAHKSTINIILLEASGKK